MCLNEQRWNTHVGFRCITRQSRARIFTHKTILAYPKAEIYKFSVHKFVPAHLCPCFYRFWSLRITNNTDNAQPENRLLFLNPISWLLLFLDGDKNNIPGCQCCSMNKSSKFHTPFVSFYLVYSCKHHLAIVHHYWVEKNVVSTTESILCLPKTWGM